MPWKSSSPMEQRIEFIEAWLEGEKPVSRLCLEIGISRKTAYKTIARFKANGMNGLYDMPRRPHSHPATTSDDIASLICKMRGKHPHEGAETLLERLRRKHPGLPLPAPSTAHEILRRNGLIIQRRRRRQATPTPPDLLAVPEAANHVLSVDFKGDFCLGNGERCFPLTITDNYSRYLLRCVGMTNKRRGYEEVKAIMEACFIEHGLPTLIRSDNGPPFASTGLYGWSRLAVWWMRLGIQPERIEPGKPQQNGRHERMHRTLKAAVCKPAEYSMRAQQDRFDSFRKDYNFARPHHALDMRTPAELYAPSPRQMPLRIPPIDYPSHMLVRKVKDSGRIKLDGHEVRIADALLGEHLGLKFEDDDRTVTLYFCEVEIGTINLHERDWKFTPSNSALGGGA